MCYLNNCFCCTIETGGKIAGWLLILINFITGISLTWATYNLIIADCEFIQGISVGINTCHMAKIWWLTLSSLAMIFSFFLCVITKSFINGISNQNHQEMRPGYVFNSICMLLTILGQVFEVSLSFSLEKIVVLLVYTIVYLYIYLVLFSVYVKIRNDEKKITYKGENEPLDQTSV